MIRTSSMTSMAKKTKNTKNNSRWRKSPWWVKLTKLIKKSSKLLIKDNPITGNISSNIKMMMKVVRKITIRRTLWMMRSRRRTWIKWMSKWLVRVTHRSTQIWSLQLKRWDLTSTQNRCASCNSLSFNKTLLTSLRKETMIKKMPGEIAITAKINCKFKMKTMQSKTTALKTTKIIKKMVSRRTVTTITWWSTWTSLTPMRKRCYYSICKKSTINILSSSHSLKNTWVK